MGAKSTDLTTQSAFQMACAAIPNGDARHDQLRALGAKFVTSAKFVGDVTGNALTTRLDAASTAVDELLATKDKPSRNDLETVLTTIVAHAVQLSGADAGVSYDDLLRGEIELYWRQTTGCSYSTSVRR